MSESFNPQPVDYRKLIAEGIPEPEFLVRPYLPAGVSVWAVGPAESGKSIWALAQACELSRRSQRVVYVSQENPLQVELQRLDALRPDPDFLELYHYAGFDLAVPDHVDALAQIAEGAALIVLDTFTACWSGDENDNAAVVGFDRDVRALIAYTGATVLTLDHTGHPQAFVKRDGVAAPRGASAKGQKADVGLAFRAEGEHEFSIGHWKNRPGGGRKEPVRQYRVVDNEDFGTLELIAVENAHDRKVTEAVETIVSFLDAQQRVVGTKELRAAMRGTAGVEVLNDALAALDREDPLRVRHQVGRFLAMDGTERRMHGYWVSGVR